MNKNISSKICLQLQFWRLNFELEMATFYDLTWHMCKLSVKSLE